MYSLTAQEALGKALERSTYSNIFVAVKVLVWMAAKLTVINRFAIISADRSIGSGHSLI
jgi:hypothetical protein